MSKKGFTAGKKVIAALPHIAENIIDMGGNKTRKLTQGAVGLITTGAESGGFYMVTWFNGLKNYITTHNQDVELQ